MKLVAALRRAFAANPHQIAVGEEEKASLTARGIQQPTIQTYFVWRRSLMLFVVLATLVSATLATYREYAETEEGFDVMQTMTEHFAPPSPEEMEEDEDDEDADEEEAVEEDEADEDETDDLPKTAFAQFHDAVELVSLYILPIAALAVVVLWTRLQATFRILVAAFAFSFLVPLLFALCPWSWWGVDDPEYNRQTQPLQYFGSMAEGFLDGVEQLVRLLPIVLAMVPGVQRACVRVKLLLPQSMLPGFFLVTASPFYALFLLVVFVGIVQFDSQPLFIVGMLLFLCAPLTYAVRSDLFTRPIQSDDDYRRIRVVQRIVGGITALAGILLATFLATREFGDIRLLGTDPKNSLLVPLDIVEFLLEVLSRSMFITVLGADLFMRMNLTAWKNTRHFAGTPEAENYDRVMGELERVA